MLVSERGNVFHPSAHVSHDGEMNGRRHGEAEHLPSGGAMTRSVHDPDADDSCR